MKDFFLRYGFWIWLSLLGALCSSYIMIAIADYYEYIRLDKKVFCNIQEWNVEERNGYFVITATYNFFLSEPRVPLEVLQAQQISRVHNDPIVDGHVGDSHKISNAAVNDNSIEEKVFFGRTTFKKPRFLNADVAKKHIETNWKLKKWKCWYSSQSDKFNVSIVANTKYEEKFQNEIAPISTDSAILSSLEKKAPKGAFLKAIASAIVCFYFYLIKNYLESSAVGTGINNKNFLKKEEHSHEV